MNFLIALLYLSIAVVICCFLYFWTAVFKVMGDATVEEINEGEDNPEELADEKETNIINHIGTFIFIISGVLIWTFLALFTGKIANDLTDHFLLKWLSYFFIYFLFLRFPFGVINKIIKKFFEFKNFPEKGIFALVNIVFFIVGGIFAAKAPHFSEWFELLVG